MSTQLAPRKPRKTPLHRWPWAWVILGLIAATFGQLLFDIWKGF